MNVGLSARDSVAAMASSALYEKANDARLGRVSRVEGAGVGIITG